MGRDLFCKLRAQITFDSDSMAALKLRGPELLKRRNGDPVPLRKRFLSFLLRFQEYGLRTTPMDWLRTSPLVGVELKPEAILLARGNTAFLARPKLRPKSILTDYLHAVNSATVTLHSVVPNPYTLLGLIPAEAKFFIYLDLKDAFSCICLAPQSQPISAFQWESPNTGEKG
jgi:hypothetical protein